MVNWRSSTLVQSLLLFLSIVAGFVGVCTILFQFTRSQSLPGAIGAGIGLTLLDRWHRRRRSSTTAGISPVS